MPESTIGDEIWSGLTAIEKIEVVRDGRATLRQLNQGLLDGPEELRSVCRELLSHIAAAPKSLSITICAGSKASTGQHKVPKRAGSDTAKTRGGLPKGFALANRSQRTRLLEENVYRLPDGREFVPCVPEGSLGTIGHRYALLTPEQYEQSRKGSIYVRMDGRIFDYSDSSFSATEFFDTGFKMDDLERTGCYVNRPSTRNLKSRKVKPSRSMARQTHKT